MKNLSVRKKIRKFYFYFLKSFVILIKKNTMLRIVFNFRKTRKQKLM